MFDATHLLQLYRSAFTEFPVGVLAMTQLMILNVSRRCSCRFARCSAHHHHHHHHPPTSRQIDLSAQLDWNQIAALPREIHQLRALVLLTVSCCCMCLLPPALTALDADVRHCFDVTPVRALRAAVAQSGFSASIAPPKTLPHLTHSQLSRCRIAWLPLTLDRLPARPSSTYAVTSPSMNLLTHRT